MPVRRANGTRNLTSCRRHTLNSQGVSATDRTAGRRPTQTTAAYFAVTHPHLIQHLDARQTDSRYTEKLGLWYFQPGGRSFEFYRVCFLLNLVIFAAG